MLGCAIFKLGGKLLFMFRLTLCYLTFKAERGGKIEVVLAAMLSHGLAEPLMAKIRAKARIEQCLFHEPNLERAVFCQFTQFLDMTRTLRGRDA